jgi:hypothetical protein
MIFVRTIVRDVQPYKRTTISLHSRVRWHLPRICQKEMWLMCTCSRQSDVLAVWWLFLQRRIWTFELKCAFTSLRWHTASVPRRPIQGPRLVAFLLGFWLVRSSIFTETPKPEPQPTLEQYEQDFKRCIPGLIPQRLQLQAQETLASLGWFHRWGECAESYARSRMRVDQCISAVRAVEVPVFVCLRSSCSHMAEVGGP